MLRISAIGVSALGLALASPAAMQCGSKASASQCGSKHAEQARVQTVAMHSQKDIVDTAASAGSFGTLLAAAKAAGLVDALRGDGPITVFAPTDEAFAKLGQSTIQNLLKPENRDQLRTILLYHVVPGEVTAKKVVAANDLTTLSGQRLTVNFNDGTPVIERSNLSSVDISCSNGVIHVIDSVLIPSTNNIPETAAAAGSFSTLLAAAKAAGLVEALSGKGPITVLAPTDEAFAKLGQSTIQNLLKPENRDQLTAILTYHVIPGRVYAEQALSVARGKTLQGDKVRFRIRDGQLFANNARIVATDIDATNGVVHVIDTVLLPE